MLFAFRLFIVGDSCRLAAYCQQGIPERSASFRRTMIPAPEELQKRISPPSGCAMSRFFQRLEYRERFKRLEVKSQIPPTSERRR